MVAVGGFGDVLALAAGRPCLIFVVIEIEFSQQTVKVRPFVERLGAVEHERLLDIRPRDDLEERGDESPAYRTTVRRQANLVLPQTPSLRL